MAAEGEGGGTAEGSTQAGRELRSEVSCPELAASLPHMFIRQNRFVSQLWTVRWFSQLPAHHIVWGS